MRASKARTGHSTGNACQRRWLAYGNEPDLDGIDSCLKDDRDGRRRRLCRHYSWTALGRNHVHRAPDEIGRQRRKTIVASLGVAIFNSQVLVLDITAFF